MQHILLLPHEFSAAADYATRLETYRDVGGYILVAVFCSSAGHFEQLAYLKSFSGGLSRFSTPEEAVARCSVLTRRVVTVSDSLSTDVSNPPTTTDSLRARHEETRLALYGHRAK